MLLSRDFRFFFGEVLIKVYTNYFFPLREIKISNVSSCCFELIPLCCLSAAIRPA